MNPLLVIALLSYFTGGASPAQKTTPSEVLLDPAYRGTVRLYSAPDKKKLVKTLRQNVKDEDWLYFEVKETNDSMFHVSAEFNIAGHVASGWIEKSQHIGVYSRVYEGGKSLILYAEPKKGVAIAKIAGYTPKLIPVTDCSKGWAKVKVMNKGKEVEGWMPPEEQCTDSYSTCN